MDYFVIADEDTVLGFSLVGVEGMVARNEKEARSAWDRANEGDGHSIVIVSTECADMMRDIVDSYSFSGTFPLIVEIGVRGNESPDLRELVNRAIGVSL